MDKKVPKMATKDHIGFWTTKVFYLVMFIVVPIVVVGWQHALIGYLITAGITGVIISIVFQLAHVVEDVEFPMPNEDTHKIEQNWFIHQLQTTSNFSTRSKIVSWMTGGLNFQVEHHLFPKISHIHYPAINRIVQQVCAKYNVPYHEHRTLIGALGSHLQYLKVVGQTA
ncbi:Fatty acid desaturase [compost metagenome]